MKDNVKKRPSRTGNDVEFFIPMRPATGGRLL